jgi:dolichol-phosphate mannosyltransferase
MAAAIYDLSLIIPCYNESEGIASMRTRLAEVLPTLRQQGSLELLLIDDGSTDDTYNLLREAFAGWREVRIVRHERNKGLGAALRTGFAEALGEIIITCDSDGTYPFSEIPNMLVLLTPDIDIVTASPYHPQGGIENVPAYRVALSKSASLLYRILLDWNIHTYTAMFRAYRRDVIETINSHSNGFLMVTEMLVEALLVGYKVAEYPTTLRVRRYGQSKARLWRITRSHFQYQWGLLGRRRSTEREAVVGSVRS